MAGIEMMSSIREHSLEEARSLNYPVNPNLPALDELQNTRSATEAGRRMLTLHAVVASACGFPKEKALEWLNREGLAEALEAEEKEFLETITNAAQNNAMQWQVEALWALAWALGCHDTLDFTDSCADDFVFMLPDLKVGAAAEPFLAGLTIRSNDELLAKCDLAYCLHWGARDAALSAKTIEGAVPENVIRERRRALEWLIGEDGWYEVSLDT
jgi:hypothetical protein